MARASAHPPRRPPPLARWISIRVVLVSGMGTEITKPPGRLFLASPRHTLADLAAAIDLAFARWDISHLHLFRIGEIDYTSYPEEQGQPDSNDTRLGDLLLEAGSAFVYVFDLGDDWTHECMVEDMAVDPEEVLGGTPAEPAPFFGWGSIPDQYGRETEAQAEDDVP